MDQFTVYMDRFTVNMEQFAVGYKYLPFRVGRNLALYQARGGGTAGLIFRDFPFQNKADAGKPSVIWGQKIRIRLQCRVTTPLWAHGADSGQREKKNEIGGEIRSEK